VNATHLRVLGSIRADESRVTIGRNPKPGRKPEERRSEMTYDQEFDQEHNDVEKIEHEVDDLSHFESIDEMLNELIS
jgi:hypothetical protein